MNKKSINVFLILLLASCVFAGCKPTTPHTETGDSQQSEYTADLLMCNTLDTIEYYSNDIRITKIENNEEIQPEYCLFNTITEDFVSLTTQCHDFWTHCIAGGTSYSETLGSITKNYEITFDGTNCNVVYTYYDSNANPLGSAYRITKNYTLSFTTNHLSICYENENKSFYNETKYYIDIIVVENGIFVQYYKKQYNGDYFRTYSYDIYKLYYNLKTENLLYSSNQIKHGSTTSTISNIEITTFENFEMPEFMYNIEKL